VVLFGLCEQEGEAEHEHEDQRQPALELTGEVLRAGGVAAEIGTRAVDAPDGRRDDVTA
jgi:hypothetical protein